MFELNIQQPAIHSEYLKPLAYFIFCTPGALPFEDLHVWSEYAESISPSVFSSKYFIGHMTLTEMCLMFLGKERYKHIITIV